ncbi:MAG: site-2 protease family protein [Candidatus Woesearchaeota archaeon]
MAIIGLMELLNLVILTVAIGYIFTGFIRTPEHMRTRRGRFSFNWQDFKFSMLIAAPGIVLHELAHKFVALGFGMNAAFHIWYQGLGVAIFLKLIHSPFLLIAPGFVLINDAGVSLTPFMSNLAITIIAFAGPLTNLVLWFIAGYILSNAKHLTRKQAMALFLTKRINMLLFVFNMLPIPPLDGSKVFLGLFKLISSSF